MKATGRPGAGALLMAAPFFIPPLSSRREEEFLTPPLLGEGQGEGSSGGGNPTSGGRRPLKGGAMMPRHSTHCKAPALLETLRLAVDPGVGAALESDGFASGVVANLEAVDVAD